MAYDLTKWFLMPSTIAGLGYGRETHHLEGVTLTGAPADREYHIDTGKNLVIMKDPRGWPWDVKSYDQNFIYDWITELDWTSPRNYKAFNPPLSMCPRFWDGDPYNSAEIIHPTSNYDTFINCKKVQSANLQEVAYNIHAPVLMDFGGDVGEQETIIIEYYWDSASNRELLYLTRKAGWVKWCHQSFVSSVYVTDAMTLHNKIVPSGAPTLQFPCLAIP